MKHLFMISLSLLHLGMTYSSDPLEFTPYDLGFLTVLSTAVFASQSAACRVLSRWRRTQNLLLSGFTVANVLSLNLLLSPSFTDLPVQYAVTAIAGGQLTLYVLFDTMDVLPLFAQGLPAVTTLATVTVSILAYASLPPIGSKAAPGTTSAPHIRRVSFESTPNVYIVAFDALAPRALLQKHLGIDSTAYLDVLDAHFRRFPNFFSDGPLTKESLSRFLALDKAYFATLTRREAPYGLFPGLTPSPFFEIFTANGYETNTVYMLNSFGKRTGPFVDRHVASNAIGACAFVPKHLRASALFGYCRLVTLDALLTILRAAGLDPGLDASRPIDQLIGAMTQGLARPRPQLFFSYIWSPGHTERTFDFSNPEHVARYTESFTRRSRNTALDLQRLVDFVAQHDPDAILFVFGDHGPWLSRRMRRDRDATFVVQDRWGVYGGIHPPDRCRGHFEDSPRRRFMTPFRVAHDLIRYLSGGTPAYRRYQDLGLDRIAGAAPDDRYDQYLYE